MDAITLLKTDHDKVKKLFKELEQKGAGQREALFKEIDKELTVHAEIEEKLFYPAVQNAKPTHDLILESFEEHKQVKKVLADLGSADKSTEHWLAGFKVLTEDVLHHVKEEEEELFPKIKDKILSAEELRTLGVKMEEMKQQQMSRVSR